MLKPIIWKIIWLTLKNRWLVWKNLYLEALKCSMQSRVGDLGKSACFKTAKTKILPETYFLVHFVYSLPAAYITSELMLCGKITSFFSEVHTIVVHVELFHQPTLMHNFLYSLTICLLYYYPRHVSRINMPIFRRKNCIHTAPGIFALCKRLHSTLVESGLTFVTLLSSTCFEH